MNETPLGKEGGKSGPIGAAFDGETSSYYHSDWSGSQPGKTLPQAFTIDLGETESIIGFKFLPRQNNDNGLMTKYDVYVSDTPYDLNALPEGEGTFSGTFETNDRSEKTVLREKAVTGRYVLVVARESKSTNWFCCAEFNLLTDAQYINVTYNLKWNGETKKSYEMGLKSGSAYPAPVLPYGVKADTPEGVVTETTTKDIECTAISDAIFVDTKTDALNKWYTLRLRDNYYAFYNGTEITYNQNTQLGALENSKLFQLVGNPFDGFKLYNRATDKAFGSDNVNTGTSLTPRDDARTYILELNNGNFNLREKESPAGYMNRNNNKLSYWNNPNAKGEVGSTLVFKSVEELSNALLAHAQKFADTYKDPSAHAANPSVEKYNALVAAIPTTPANTVEDFNQQQSALKTALDAMDCVIPNGMYTLRETRDETDYWYMGVNHENKGIATSDINGAHKLWNITRQESGNYVLRSVTSEKYLPIPQQSQQVVMSEEAAEHIFKLTADGKVTFGGSENFQAIHAAAQNTIVGWERETKASQWIIEPVESISVTTTEELDKYTTFSAPFATKIPEGIKAYKGIGIINESKFTLEEVTNVIPKNTGVLLQSTAAGTFSFVKTDDIASLTENELLPSLAVAPKAENTYTLQKKENVVAFYPCETANVAGFTAFLLTREPAPESITIDFDKITGVKEVKTTTTGNRIYDLQGRRVLKAQGGLYIVNGKKTIIR